MYLHYIWINFKDELDRNPVIPENFKYKINNCTRLNNDLEVKIWNGYDCRELLINNFPEYLKLYDSLPYPIMKCDMIRYFILYKYGGFYMDCDRTCLKPLSELITKYNEPDVMVGYFNYDINFHNIVYYNNDFLYSKQGSLFMKQCFQNIKLSIMPNKTLQILNTGGPIFLRNQIVNYNGNEKIIKLSKEINSCDVCGCTPDLSQQYTFSDFSKSSWLSFKEKIIFFFLCNRHSIILLIIISMLIVKLCK